MGWQYTADVPDDFEGRLVEVAHDLSTPEGPCDPLSLVACWFSESEVRAMAHNPGGDAVGIFQAMPATLHGLGFPGTWREFVRLTATDQLAWAARYYAPHRGRLLDAGAVYLATFLPALMAHAGSPTFVLCGRSGPMAWAYGPNHAAFDPDLKGTITVGDLLARIQRVTKGPRWLELVQRVTAAKAAAGDDVDDESDPSEPCAP